MAQIKAHLKGKEIKIEGIGFVGTACDVAMKAFESALGSVTAREDKPELYVQPDPVPESLEQR